MNYIFYLWRVEVTLNKKVCIDCSKELHICKKCNNFYSPKFRDLYIHREFYCNGGNIKRKKFDLIEWKVQHKHKKIDFDFVDYWLSLLNVT